ncbi:MAG: class I SAM-dependent methyltransferase [Sphingomonadaceae bacterium]|nr:class I SAM-dependent methyltransferase [Sphingomonadaceae bacterium]
MGSEISTGRKRNSHPYDWCVDESWVAWQLFEALGQFRQEKEAGEAIWDPCAGSGRTMVTFVENGFKVFTSDIVHRIDPDQYQSMKLPVFASADFLEVKKAPAACSIVCNPPFSYVADIAEAFVRHALRLATRRVCMLLPIKWEGSQGRFRLFAEDHPPQAVLILTQRPSMPPGDMIESMGRKAFNGGVVDYAWYVWNVQQPTKRNESCIIWLPPLKSPEELLPVEGLA